MSEVLGQLGSFFSGPSGKALGTLGTLGLTGAGLAGNISAERQRSQELNYLKQQQAQLADPTKLAEQVAAATQPLNRGLVQSVGNQVSGTLAEQGLAQAPGIQGTVLAQALAPFEQQNQNTALQLVMKRLGLPIEYAQTLLAGNPGQTNLAPLLALLQKGGGGGGGGGGTAIDPSNIGSLMKLLGSSQMPGLTPSTSQLPDWLSSSDTSTGDTSAFSPGA